MDDYDVVSEVLNGNREMFRILVKRYYEQIYLFVRKQLSNHDDALDFTQEIFIKIYLNLNVFNPEKASFKTWIYKIAANFCVDYFKSNAYKFKGLLKTLEDDILVDDKSSDRVIKTESLNEITRFIHQRLKKKQRLIIQLYYYAELEANEIAVLLDIPVKTVYSSLSLSVKKIRMGLEAYYG